MSLKFKHFKTHGYIVHVTKHSNSNNSACRHLKVAVVRLPEAGTDFGDLAVPFFFEHLWTFLPSVGWHLDDKTFP